MHNPASPAISPITVLSEADDVTSAQASHNTSHVSQPPAPQPQLQLPRSQPHFAHITVNQRPDTGLNPVQKVSLLHIYVHLVYL